MNPRSTKSFAIKALPMNTRHTLHRSIILYLLLFVTVAGGAHAAFAATLTYPSAPCSTTLQACIAAAAAGDVVQVATNVPIGEDLLIDKSLTLRPAPGFSPVLNDSASVKLQNVEPPSK